MPKRSLAILLAILLLVIALALFYGFVIATPLAEPSYQDRSLREWLRAQPPGSISYDDIIVYRRTALQAMGEPAVAYLRWVLLHPRKMIEGHTTALDQVLTRLRPFLPKSFIRVTAPPRNRLNFMNVVVALELIGPAARPAAPALIALWESNGHVMYSGYNGFPLALSQLADDSPQVLSALHRHFDSPDRLHRALCAFAAWKLHPSDAEAIRIVREELSSSARNTHPRFTLIDTISRWGGTNAEFFIPELESLETSMAPEPNPLVSEAIDRIKRNPPLRKTRPYRADSQL